MELMKNLRWICRVCAVNIKRVRSSTSAVSIFGTPHLRDMLRKYLAMDIKLNDPLPKSICGSCFKKLESIHNFAILAKKTESFLKDFINIARSNIKEPVSDWSTRFQNEFASFALCADKDDVIVCDPPDNQLTSTNDVVLNFTVNEPLTKNIQSKLSTYNDTPTGSTQTSNRNNLEEKRRNLKMILVNNNAQQPTYGSSNNKNILRTSNHPAISAPSPSIPSQNMATISPSTSIEQSFQRDSLIYDCLNLGCVIKDMDLLKLILKALKWPFTNETLPAQIQRLKSTRFREVILDQNLLQDTDLMQILNTYLSPILLQSQRNEPIAQTSVMSYRIPADTSIHLAPVPLEESSSIPPKLRRRTYTRRKPKLPVRSCSPIEILSDDSEDVQMFEVSIDPTLYFPPERDSESQDAGSGTDPFIAGIVKKKQKKEKSVVRKRRKQKRKEMHTNMHNDGVVAKDVNELIEEEIDVVNVDAVLTDSTPQDNKNFESEKKDKDEDNKIPEISLIDENSGDDAIWAEFKVTDSPDHATGEEKEVRNREIKEEPIEDDEDPTEIVIVEVINDETTHIPKDEEGKSDPTVKEEDMPVKKKRGRKKKIIISEDKCSEGTNNDVETEAAGTAELRQSKRKSLINIEPTKSKRLLERNSKGDHNTASQRKSTRISSTISKSPPKVIRESNRRKRTCRQCNFTFVNLMDFVKHRKIHM